jgi:hypothetical protein
LVAAIILGALFFGIGTQAAAFHQAERTARENPASSAGNVQSTGVDPASFQKRSEDPAISTPLPAERTHAPAKMKTDGQLASGGQKAKKRDESELPQSTSSEPLDVLVLGVDKSTGPEGDGSSRSDTLMLVRVTPATGEVKLLSVPRDLYVEVEPGVKTRSTPPTPTAASTRRGA